MQTLFEKNYSHPFPLATDDFSNGVRKMERRNALEHKHIQTNIKNYPNLITFDIDVENSESYIKTLAWDDEIIPAPNWIAVNPFTTHSHIGYILDGGIGTAKGREYLKDVRGRLALLIGADPAYNSTFTRNPLEHPTSWETNHIYKLKELDEYTEKIKKSFKIRIEENDSMGRNDLIFNSLRKHAYSFYRKAGFQQTLFEQMVETKALELYYEISDKRLFPISELNAIVKSVTKWTIKNHSKEEFSKIQTARIKKRWGNTKQTNHTFLLHLNEELGMRPVEIAEELGITQGAVRTALWKARKERKLK